MRGEGRRKKEKRRRGAEGFGTGERVVKRL
jgi:hypothetical protein